MIFPALSIIVAKTFSDWLNTELKKKFLVHTSGWKIPKSSFMYIAAIQGLVITRLGSVFWPKKVYWAKFVKIVTNPGK